MTSMMRAVIKRGPGVEGIEIGEVEVPTAGAGQVVVDVLATGICGTDVHIAHDEYAHERPVVMGHEVLGVVSSVGSDEDAGWLGAEVAIETYFSACEVCDMCRRGRRNLCRDRRSIGSFRNGGFAEKLLVPVTNLHRLPDMPGELDGVLSEPLACIAQCLLDPPVVQPGDRVLVTGPGAMGQLAAQVAKASGGLVTLAGLPADAERLAVAADFGVAITMEPPPEHAFDVVVECSGSASGAAGALRAARRGARYVQVGIFGRDVMLPFDIVLYKELTVTSGFASTPSSWRSAMRLIEAGDVVLTPLITKRVPLDAFFDALDAAARGEGLKTVITPRETRVR
ncbi:alcohol dehydrogenase catalytic domain-containing protein [Microbacterium sp.]|uniref:alcohol dehydrogenase catalytic domain-containing protein n=1 Tax=Microbacterium sp. TaxID=51671 RepID=UPI002733A9EC|nr:alcohol dehydrogenase catalytic domain-containing protein [Microbacterium sp.]MDP3950234.1 alcohol dehydrogenase catalytic domain-containing protein [Microbacterium sp.]